MRKVVLSQDSERDKEIKAHQKRVREKEKEIKALKDKTIKLKNELSQTLNYKKAYEKDRNQKIKDLAFYRSEAKEQIASLLGNNIHLLDENQLVHHDLNNALQERTMLTQQLTKQQQQVEQERLEMRDQIQYLQDLLSDFQNQAAAYSQKVEETIRIQEEEINSLRQGMEYPSKNERDMQVEINKLREQLEEEICQKNNALGQVEELINEITELEEEMKRLQTEQSTLANNREEEDLAAENESLRTQNAIYVYSLIGLVGLILAWLLTKLVD